MDGLRAVAVLPVMLFHAGFNQFAGGFVGVDVFFVISGYLITSIILYELADGKFTIGRFYDRRIRRIFPALAVVMLTCIPLAFLWMLPDDLENFGQSLIATTAFSNNVLLAVTSNYFQLASEFKPLLHTWSLGVEEQYYVFFPLLLLALWRFGHRVLLSSLLVLTVASLALSQRQLSSNPQGAFYFLQNRGWELLVGALIANWLILRPPVLSAGAAIGRELAAGGGLLLIVASVFLFDQTTPFPGVAAILPVGGAGLIILYATPDTVTGRILGSRLLVGLGLISYSLYLWHQPLFAFTRIRSLDQPSAVTYILLILASAALAILTWKFVEMPFRKGVASRRLMWIGSFAVSAMIATVGAVLYARSGFVDRWDELSTGVREGGRRLNALYNEGPYIYRGMQFTDPSKPNVLIVGDSFARDFINAAKERGYLSKQEISYSDTSPRWCMASAADIPEKLRFAIAQADYLVFASDQDKMLRCWSRDSALFRKIGAKNIIVIGPKNFGWNMNAVMRLSASERVTYRAKVLETETQRNARMSAIIPASEFVDVLAMIGTDGGKRVPVFTEMNKLISQDAKHLTKAGAEFVGRKIFEHPLLRPFK